MALINHTKLRISLEAAVQDGNPGAFFADLRDALESGQLKPEEFSIRKLFEELVPNGRELVESFNPHHGPSQSVQTLEAAGVVDTSAFSNIIGQILYTKVLDSFNDPTLLWSQLVEVIPTNFNGEKIPGIGQIGDRAGDIGESEQYPYAGVSEEWIETPPTKKRGFIVPVTKEAIFFDRTGLALRRASDVSKWLAVNIEKRVLDAVTGITNTYKRNGVSNNTYLSSGAYVNIKASNALADWTDVEAALLLFDALTDPNTGEPIAVVPNQLLVPSALKMTANRVLTATEVRHGGDTTAAHLYTASGNPIQQQFQLLSNSYVKNRTSSDTTWFIGDFKRAFAYMQNWAVQTVPAPANSEAEFNRDIVNQFKVSERGEVAVLEPRACVKCTA